MSTKPNPAKRVIRDSDDEEVKEQPPKKLQKVEDDGNGKATGLSQISAPQPVEDGSSDDSDDEGKGKNRIKWKRLEHHGVVFAPPYKPHGVKILHKGQPLELTAEQEEVCNFWANIIGSEFANNERVI